MLFRRTTSDISNSIPINVGGSLFPQSEIDEMALSYGLSNDVAGCGPIAMIGIFDYFARYLGYQEIMDDPTNTVERKELAKKIIQSTTSYVYSEDNTITFPLDYVSGFNNVAELYDLDDNFQATHHTFGLLEKIINSINNGIPVTMYNGISMDTSSNFGNQDDFEGHYVNIYGYEKWIVNNEENYFLITRLNWPGRDGGPYYATADMLNKLTTGIITYSVDYENVRNFNMTDFSVLNSAYSHYNTAVDMSDGSNYYIEVSGTNIAYLDNQYLSLRGSYSTSGDASIQFNFIDSEVKKMEINVGAYSFEETFSPNTVIEIYCSDSYNNLYAYYSIPITEIGIDKDSLIQYSFLFREKTDKVLIKLDTRNQMVGDYTGRIIFDSIKFYDDDNDNTHIHKYNYSYLNSTSHSITCRCGYSSVNNHSFELNKVNLVEMDPLYMPTYVCTYCGYSTTRLPIGI